MIKSRARILLDDGTVYNGNIISGSRINGSILMIFELEGGEKNGRENSPVTMFTACEPIARRVYHAGDRTKAYTRRGDIIG